MYVCIGWILVYTSASPTKPYPIDSADPRTISRFRICGNRLAWCCFLCFLGTKPKKNTTQASSTNFHRGECVIASQNHNQP